MSEVLYIPWLGTTNVVRVIVDGADFDRFVAENWRMHPEGYAQRRATAAERSSGLPECVKLHRLILGAAPRQIVDHINGDKFDCRRANLRICTRGQNNMNKGFRAKNNTTGERGVYRQNGGWIDRLARDRVKHYRGTFATFAEAVVAKRALEADLYGVFGSARHLGRSSAVA